MYYITNLVAYIRCPDMMDIYHNGVATDVQPEMNEHPRVGDDGVAIVPQTDTSEMNEHPRVGDDGVAIVLQTDTSEMIEHPRVGDDGVAIVPQTDTSEMNEHPRVNDDGVAMDIVQTDTPEIDRQRHVHLLTGMSVATGDIGSQSSSDMEETGSGEPDSSESDSDVMENTMENTHTAYTMENTHTAHTIEAKHDIVVSIQIPAKDAICPISLDTVESSEVCGFEGFRVDMNHPEYTEIVLPCLHSFSACYLVVSWLTAPMRCPLCRHGVDVRLDPATLHGPWQQAAKDHVARIKDMERTEQLAEDYEQALRLGLNNNTNIQLYMCVYMVHSDGSVHSSVVQFSPHTPALPETAVETLTLTVTRANVRLISGLIHNADCIAIDMVVFARCEGGGVELVEVANSGMFDMPTRMDDGSEPPPYVSPHPARTFIMNRPSTQQDTSSLNLSPSFFSMVWQQYPNYRMDTMTDIQFSIPFIDLAMVVGGLFWT